MTTTTTTTTIFAPLSPSGRTAELLTADYMVGSKFLHEDDDNVVAFAARVHMNADAVQRSVENMQIWTEHGLYLRDEEDRVFFRPDLDEDTVNNLQKVVDTFRPAAALRHALLRRGTESPAPPPHGPEEDLSSAPSAVYDAAEPPTCSPCPPLDDDEVTVAQQLGPQDDAQEVTKPPTVCSPSPCPPVEDDEVTVAQQLGPPSYNQEPLPPVRRRRVPPVVIPLGVQTRAQKRKAMREEEATAL